MGHNVFNNFGDENLFQYDTIVVRFNMKVSFVNQDLIVKIELAYFIDMKTTSFRVYILQSVMD